MSENDFSADEVNQNPKRRLWPWVITSIVALLVALFLRVWVPQEQDTNLLQRIEAAEGSYSIDTAGRPEAGSFLPEAGSILDDMKYVELFDRVEDLKLPKVDSELFQDSVSAFKSLESLNFDVANSVDFDRETAARMTDLKLVRVFATEDVDVADYEFLAGCKSVEQLVLAGEFHDDGFWQYLPEMDSLERLEIQAGSKLHGEGIPDLSKSNFSSASISGLTPDCEFHSLANLFTAGRLNELSMERVAFNLNADSAQIGPTSLTSLTLQETTSTDKLVPILAQVKTLEKLSCTNNQLTGESLDLLATLPLSQMEFTSEPLTAEAFENLSKFGSLNRLHLIQVNPQADWLLSWADSPLSSSLESLVLTSHPANDELIDVLTAFSSLKSLTIVRGTVSDAAMLKLADHPTLEQLDVHGGSNEFVFEFRKKVNERGSKFPEIHHWVTIWRYRGPVLRPGVKARSPVLK